jgi:hypothetical protein
MLDQLALLARRKATSANVHRSKDRTSIRPLATSAPNFFMPNGY